MSGVKWEIESVKMTEITAIWDDTNVTWKIYRLVSRLFCSHWMTHHSHREITSVCRENFHDCSCICFEIWVVLLLECSAMCMFIPQALLHNTRWCWFFWGWCDNEQSRVWWEWIKKDHELRGKVFHTSYTIVTTRRSSNFHILWNIIRRANIYVGDVSSK